MTDEINFDDLCPRCQRLVQGMTAPQGRPRKTGISDEEIVRLRAEGMTYRAIGKQLGVTAQTVANRLKKYQEKT